MKKILLLLLPLALLSCNKREFLAGPNAYADGFEAYSQVDDLIDGEDVRWSFFQQTLAGNAVGLSLDIVHSGSQSIRCIASPSTEEGGASKADIAKQNMAFWEGETVQMEAWYYLVGSDKAEWLFLMDIEDQALVGAGPGMRLALVEDALLIEHKYFNPNIAQPEGQEIQFPRDQWVKVTFEALLSKKKEGYVKVWQDDVLIIEQYEWNTLPKDVLYFQQGTRGGYSSVQFGLTANTRDNAMTLYVDDVRIQVVN